MKIISVIDQPEVIKAILLYVGLGERRGNGRRRQNIMRTNKAPYTTVPTWMTLLKPIYKKSVTG
jgi:hypothetical protein